MTFLIRSVMHICEELTGEMIWTLASVSERVSTPDSWRLRAGEGA